MFQRTLRSSVAANGIGVHSGRAVKIWLHPAPVDHGIKFYFNRNQQTKIIPADVSKVIDTRMSTCLGSDGAKVGMVEHLLSALAGLGLDNVRIEITTEELPIMDGSASPYVFLLQSAGIVEQTEAKKKFFVVKKKTTVTDGDMWCSIEPFDRYRIEFKIDFDHPSFNAQNQTAVFDFSTTTYLTNLCRARTFGFARDHEFYLKQNLALGSSMDNAIVLDDEGIMNEQGLRYVDEFVRHKILDAVGDFYLLGCSVIGHFKGYKSGHTLNNMLLNALLSDPDSFEITTEVDSSSVYQAVTS